MDNEEYLRRAGEIADAALRSFTEHLNQDVADGTLPAAAADEWRGRAELRFLSLKNAGYDPAALDRLDAVTALPPLPPSAMLEETIELAMEQIERLWQFEDEGGESG